jgi:arylsulfatase A-like enzyme
MKKLFRILVPLIFIGIAIFSILLVIKPGASIFHFKQNVDTDEIIPHDGHAFRYLIHINTLIFPSEGGLLYEDGQPLERTFTPEVVNKGLGNYSLVDKEDGLLYLNFSASDNSNPLTNGKNYTLYYKAIFLSRGMGLSLLGILTLVLAWFLIFALKSPDRRQALTTSPLSIWQVFDDFLFKEFTRVIDPVSNPRALAHSRRTLWIFLLILSVAAAYFYVFMEWLFFVTKPSFMDLMGWFEKIELFLLPSFAFAILSLTLVMIFAGLDFLSSRLRSITLLIFIGTLIPSIYLTAISLLLVDNFTYTIFNFGVVTSDGIWRYAYAVCTLILFIYINNRILKVMGLRGQSESPIKIPRFILPLIAGLLMISAGFALARFGFGSSENAQATSLAGNNNRFAVHPNILLIGSDGLNASNLSLYGYERDTTPVLRELARMSLLAENVFTNSSNTTGSITSMLTGKPPAQTRVLYPHNILQGTDAYQHLPGILRKEGYSTVEIGVRNYVDAYQINLLDGFDTVNERSITEGEVVRVPRELGFGDNVYFGSRLVERISDRIMHISFIKEMENPYTIVTQHVDKMYDRERQYQLLELIRNSDHPLFVHVHMMGTHGARFHPEQQFFSLGMTQEEGWMTDFYDDSILNFDKYIGEVLDTLEQTGKINNTILIIYSDHPMRFNIRWRVPLLIHFPNGEFAGRIKTNVQNLDILPTILDYLGFEQPEWMAGQSLLKGDPPEKRLIFSTGTSLGTQIGQGNTETDSARVKPPFYQFSFFNVVNCHKWYLLDLINLTWSSGEVPGHSYRCKQDSLLTMDQVKAELTDYLLTNGFDISTLP